AARLFEQLKQRIDVAVPERQTDPKRDAAVTQAMASDRLGRGASTLHRAPLRGEGQIARASRWSAGGDRIQQSQDRVYRIIRRARAERRFTGRIDPQCD